MGSKLSFSKIIRIEEVVTEMNEELLDDNPEKDQANEAANEDDSYRVGEKISFDPTSKLPDKSNPDQLDLF